MNFKKIRIKIHDKLKILYNIYILFLKCIEIFDKKFYISI